MVLAVLQVQVAQKVPQELQELVKYQVQAVLQVQPVVQVQQEIQVLQEFQALQEQAEQLVLQALQVIVKVQE